MNKTKFHTLYLELMLTVLLCAAGSILLFFILHTCSENLSDSEFLRTVWLSPKTEKDVDDFQNYITENSLSSNDVERIDRWQRNHPYTTIGLKKEDSFIYDSTTYGEMDGSVESWILKEPEWFQIYPVVLADGTAELYIDCYYTSLVETSCNFINAVISILAFGISLILSIRKKVHYISVLNDGIHILEGGNLEYEVPVCGNDELSSLAVSLNEMRLALAERQSYESTYTKSGDELVTALFHDIRTPLTTQMGYLEILKEHHYQTEEEQQLYLEKCLNSCKQLEEMSNDLFAYFLPHNKKEDESAVLLETYDGMELLMQLLTEHMSELEEKGIQFELEVTDVLFYLKVNVNYMYRIFNNIFSNVEKYAKRNVPVCVSVVLTEGQCMISVKNHISPTPYSTDSAQVGLESIRGLIGQMGGISKVVSDKEVFMIQIMLPAFYGNSSRYIETIASMKNE